MAIPPPECPHRMHRYAAPFLAAVVALFHAFLATAAAAQAIIVYGDESLPPYEFMEDGIAKGVNIDLWHAIGDRLGRPVEIRLTDWARAQASVLGGRGDTLSLMAPTPEREANFSFSQTTFSFSFSLFVRTDEVARFNGIPLAMRRIGVTAGGFPRPYFEKRYPDVQLIPIADNIDGIRRVLRGDIDAFAAATWSGNYLIRELGISGITPLPQPFAMRNAGIAAPHANAALLADIDRVLSQIKADGTFDRIIDQWTGDHVIIFSQKDVRFFGMAAGTIIMAIMLAGVVIAARNKQHKLAREVEMHIAAQRAQEKAAREIEDLYDNAPCGYHSLDASGLFININRTELQWLGYDRADIVGRLRAQDLLTPESLAVFFNCFPRFKRDGFIHDLELDFVRQDGTILHGLVSATAVADAAGEFIISRSALTDNGPRKIAEAALVESEMRFRSAFETAAHGMALVSTEGRFLKVNSALCAMVGYSEAELLATDFQTLTHPEDLAVDLGYVHDLLEGRIESYQMEKRYFHKTGRIVWILLGVSLVRTSKGTPIHFVSQIQDITEQRNAKAAAALRLDATQEAVRALVNASPQPMAILSMTATGEFVIDWGNERFAKLALRSLDDILGAPLGTLWPEALPSATWSALNLKDRTSLEIMTERSDGPLDIELLFTPISPLGTVIVTARDRSQERQIARKEAERHRLEALGRMAGRIAHEINNVLQPVLTYASLAWTESQGNPKARAYLDEAQDGIREGREIVRSVLALAGGHAVTRHPRQLEDEVAKALNLLVATVPSEITVETSLSPAHGLVALAPSELLQVLGNLIVNAADAITGSGQIRVSTASVNLDGNSAATFGVSPGRYAELTVSDTGKGMDEAILVRALDPFFTTKDVDRGAGLGLSTVRTILDGMGAGIGLFSSPGAGTTVRVVFPLLTPSC